MDKCRQNLQPYLSGFGRLLFRLAVVVVMRGPVVRVVVVVMM